MARHLLREGRRSMTRTLIEVGAVLCAAHRDVGTGKPHGHT
jgi:hypothetical protein